MGVQTADGLFPIRQPDSDYCLDQAAIFHNEIV